MKDNKIFKGIGVSPGIGHGEIFKLIEEPIVIPDTCGTIESEISNFNKSRTETVASLIKLGDMLKKKLPESSESGPDIFAAHIEIVKDPAVIQEIEEAIKKDQLSAAQAIKKVFSNYISTFKAMDDVYFQERAIDIEDVMKGMLRRILNLKINDLGGIDKPTIILAEDLTPSDSIQLDPQFVKGIICEKGGEVSHTAIISRSLNLPSVTGIKNLLNVTPDNGNIYLDGELGIVAVHLDDSQKKLWNEKAKKFAAMQKQIAKFKDKPSVSKDGKKMLIEANIGLTEDITKVNEVGAEGVGLFRSEFLYMNASEFPSEEMQFNAYKKAAIMHKNLVIVRTLDIGGDKSLPYYKFKDENNPFLGVRAIRWCMENLAIFRAQIRALLRASAFGEIAIMFPMISTTDEFIEAKAIVEAEKNKLKTKGIAFNKDILIGMMIEIPAAAMIADKLAKYADFFSIGTNDLIQYSMAADRTNENLNYLYQPLNPAILKLIDMTVKGGHKHNRWIGICGEAAGDANALPIWLGLGIDALSMSTPRVLRIRAQLSTIDSTEAADVAQQALQCENYKEVLKLVKDKFN